MSSSGQPGFVDGASGHERTPSPLGSSSNSSSHGIPLNTSGGSENMNNNMGGPPSLLVASSIAPAPHERGRVPVVNSSLAQAVAAGNNISVEKGSNAMNMMVNNAVKPPVQYAQTDASGGRMSSSLAAAAGMINNQQQQQPVSQQYSGYPESTQLQMQSQYQYRQNQYPPNLSHQQFQQHSVQGLQTGLQQPGLVDSGYPNHTRDNSVSASISASASISQPSEYGADEDEQENAPVKLFVGQVPKNMEEVDLTATFQEFGEIKEVLIIRDRHTGQHRGCAFVTFYNPDDATRVQEILHDKFTFPGGRKPVQIKPATEPSPNQLHLSPAPEQENKLFIGMTSRNADELSLRELFAPFGEIREIYIIRNADGTNKGCAFLKFARRESAIYAIETLNEKFTMAGATRPLIVKFADTKAQRKARTTTGTRISPIGQVPNPQGGYYQFPVYPGYQPGTHVPPSMGLHPSPYPSGYPTSYPPVSGNHPPSYMYPPSYGYPLPHSLAAGMNHGGASPVTSSSPVPGGDIYDNPVPTSGNPPPQSSLQAASVGVNRPQTQVQQQVYPPNHQTGTHHRQDVVNPRPREGPAGANLFIYHLPHDLTDADLATAFNPFGNVISAKVYVDKFTGESKGFGFVSYDSVISAEQAIEQMNGFQIGNKRLKVQHKRVNKPTAGPPPPLAGVDASGMLLPPSASDGSMPAGGVQSSLSSAIGGLQQHAAQQHHPQSALPPDINVDGLSNHLQNLDVHYNENVE